MRASPNSLRLALLLTAAALSACGKEPEPTSPTKETPKSVETKPGDAGKGAAGASAKGGAEKVPEALPDVAPLTEGVAKDVFGAALRELDTLDPEVSSRVLQYMAALGETRQIATVNEKLLAMSDGEYEDVSSAAVGLVGLLHTGDATASKRILELSRVLLAGEEDELVWTATALGAIEGADAADADAQLMAIVRSGLDDLATDQALYQLARRRSKQALDLFRQVAADGAQAETSVSLQSQVAAVAGLVALGDPSAQTYIDGWVASAADAPDLDEVIRGLGIEGLEECMAPIVQISEAVVAQGAPGIEPTAACLAVATIFRKGGGADYRDFVRRMMSVPKCECPEQGSLALLTLGDNEAMEGVAKALEHGVLKPDVYNAEITTMILETLAERKLAGAKRVTAAVDVGAQTRPDDTTPPGTRDRAFEVNCAAAYAYLASR